MARAACSTAKADGNGGQTIEDTGPLTKKRMETIDEETVAAAKDFIKRQTRGRQAVLLLVERHPHALPHPREEPRTATRATTNTPTA